MHTNYRSMQKNSEASRPSVDDMGPQEFIEEQLLHNKSPELTLSQLEQGKYNSHTLRLRAKVLEYKNIEEEMFMKRGDPPAPPEPSEHDNDNQDDEGNDDSDGHDGAGGGDWGDYDGDGDTGGNWRSPEDFDRGDEDYDDYEVYDDWTSHGYPSDGEDGHTDGEDVEPEAVREPSDEGEPRNLHGSEDAQDAVPTPAET